MVFVTYHRQFQKQINKLSSKIQKQFEERLELFLKEPFHPTLNNHGLKEKYRECRSINITGDIRAIYTVKDAETFVFLRVGTHSELYK